MARLCPGSCHPRQPEEKLKLPTARHPGWMLLPPPSLCILEETAAREASSRFKLLLLCWAATADMASPDTGSTKSFSMPSDHASSPGMLHPCRMLLSLPCSHPDLQNLQCFPNESRATFRHFPHSINQFPHFFFTHLALEHPTRA